MIQMSLAEAAAIMQAEYQVEFQAEDKTFIGIGTDSRSSLSGQLFFALSGPNFDGHDFLAAASEQSAAAAVVERQVPVNLPLLKVADTRKALGLLGKGWRMQQSIKVVALTGSNGKTTVKNMLCAILSKRGATLATRGNLNNDIGVPLTLAEISSQHDYAVIEMGANHLHEIAYLTQLAVADVAIITNAGSAHLEGFGSHQNIAKGKGEIISGVRADGTIILNREDEQFEYWRSLLSGRHCISFGLNEAADVSGIYQQEKLTINYLGANTEFACPLPGEHNARNTLAAAAAALALGCDLADVKAGLAMGFKPEPGRLEFKTGAEGALLIDDTYNASPDSVLAAAKVLLQQQKQPWILLGDLGELGPSAVDLHRDLGLRLRKLGVRKLFTVGELAEHAATGFGQDAMSFSSISLANSTIRETLHNDVCLLIKGSRSMRMEQCVAALIKKPLKGRI